MSLREQALRAMSGEETSPRARAWRIALAAAAPIYAAGSAARSAGFATGIKRSHPLGRPTVSVGNLTTGGTGKTPVVGHIARHLVEQGHRPCILLRGYRGGDEAREHRQRLGDAVRVEPNPDRVAAAQQVLAEDPAITCFILDDGFQHRRARRDLDLVLIDATNPWGYGHLLPRGLMREPKSALRRAHASIITRADQVEADEVDRLDRDIASITGRPPIAHAEHAWSGLVDHDDKLVALDRLREQQVMGVVGIGNPAAFVRTLTQHAAEVLHCEQLPDHHAYTRKTLLRLIELAQAAGADAVVTTEKDWVKWALLLEDERVVLPILRTTLAVRYRDGEKALHQLLAERIPLPVDS